jgi:serine/threonine-protein kinase SRPK3
MKSGDIIINKYISVCKLGSGMFSEVWMCIEFKTRKYFAIKIFEDPDVAEHEMEMIDVIKKNSQQSKYCLSYIEKFTYNNVLHVVQPLLAGSLYDIMKSQYPNGLPFNTILKAVFDMLSALEYLHTTLKIIHTDVKPENMLLVGHTLEVDYAISKINNYLTKTTKKITCKTMATQIKNLFTPEKIQQEISDDEMCNSDSNSIMTASDIHSEHTRHVDRMCLDSDDEQNESDESDGSDGSDESIEVIIDESYISKPTVMLGDFGNSIVLADANKHGDLQTRHYRAPEIILRHNINEKSDIWAVGCTFYELLTGKVLFDPCKSDGVTSDRQHLYDFQKILGDIPDYLKTGRKKSVFFRTDGTLKNFYSQTYTNISDLIKQKISCEQFKDVIEFLTATLDYNVDRRPSALACKKFHLFEKLQV